jgi:hypothetical protein
MVSAIVIGLYTLIVGTSRLVYRETVCQQSQHVQHIAIQVSTTLTNTIAVAILYVSWSTIATESEGRRRQVHTIRVRATDSVDARIDIYAIQIKKFRALAGVRD